MWAVSTLKELCIVVTVTEMPPKCRNAEMRLALRHIGEGGGAGFTNGFWPDVASLVG